MVNALKKNLLPLPAVTCGKSTKRSPWWYDQANEDKSRLVAERVRALEVLHSLKLKNKLSAEQKQETYFLSDEEKGK